MKAISIILMITFLYKIPFYQEFMTNRADKKFQKEYYTEALAIYSKIVQYNDSNTHILTMLGECYRMINDFKNAELWYEKAVRKPDVEPQTIFYYAEMLKANMKYQEALIWMEKYHQLNQSDIRAIRHIENKNYVEMLNLKSTNIHMKLLECNSNETDFGVAFMNDSQVVFSSSRTGTKFYDRQNRRDHTPFLNLYTANIENWELKNIHPFATELNSNLHDGPVVFSKDAKEVFITRNIYLKRSPYEERVNRLMIFRAVYDSGKWSVAETLPFNSEKYSCGHPALSPDGQYLYFVSDMPGGYGETDIYVSKRDSNTWSEPVNLGNKINTPGREMFPYVHYDGTLYFSSDGYATLGGLDILVAKKVGENYEQPVNLGSPINSQADDFAFVLSKDGFNGFLSSNRRESNNDDIYQFTIRPKPPVAVPDHVESERYVKNIRILPLVNDIMGDCKAFYISKISEKSTMGGVATLNPSSNEVIYNPTDDFFGLDTLYYTICDTLKIYGGCSESYIALNIKDVYYGLVGIVVEKGTNKPVAEVSVELQDQNLNTIEKLSTTESGDFLFNLLKDRNYTVRLVKDGYLTKNVPISTFNIPPGIQKIKEVIEIEPMKVGITFSLSIHFNTGKWDIRPDAAKELDEKALKFLNDNPTVKIELSAHTDSRGKPESNMLLSQRRAESVVNYLISKGISPDRMVAKGYGQTMLLNRCKPGVACSEEEHQVNRRVEIKILSF
ncbi:MAG: OmpA family protein [Bacteroidales bacterium]|nr:OmpA family protein [Bacteroidales bacterium]